MCYPDRKPPWPWPLLPSSRRPPVFSSVGRYSFTAVNFHHLLLAGFTGAPLALQPAHSRCDHNSWLAFQRLQPLRYLQSCSGCFRLELSPGGALTHWEAPPYHGARQFETFDRKKFDALKPMLACARTLLPHRRASALRGRPARCSSGPLAENMPDRHRVVAGNSLFVRRFLRKQSLVPTYFSLQDYV